MRGREFSKWKFDFESAATRRAEFIEQAELQGKSVDYRSLQPADLAMPVRPRIINIEDKDDEEWKGATSGGAGSSGWRGASYTGDAGGDWRSTDWQKKDAWQEKDRREPYGKGKGKDRSSGSGGWSSYGQGQCGWNWKAAGTAW